MTLYWFLLVVSSLAFGAMPAESVPIVQSLGASAMLVAGWILLIQISASMTARETSRELDAFTAARMLEKQLELFRWGGLLVSATCLLGFKLAAAIQAWPVLESSMTLQAMVLLAPGVTITAAIWIAEHRYGVALGYANWDGLQSIRELMASLMTSGGWIMLPVFAILVATDVVRFTGWFDTQVGAGIMALVSVLSVPLLVPLVVRRVWKTQPIDQTNGQWIQAIVASTGISQMPVRIWDTEMKAYNAVVAGFVPGLRSMVLTDRLLVQMPRAELTLVILHEIAHVKRLHVWWRLLAMLPCWILAALVSLLLTDMPVAGVVSNLVAVAMTLLALRTVAHTTEHDADRWACIAAMKLHSSLAPPESIHEAVDRYTSALTRVTGDERSLSRSSWLHPSVNQRCERLRRFACFQHPVDDALGSEAIAIGIGR